MGAGDSPEYKSSKEKAEKLQQKLKELKEEKEGINAQISNKENKNEEGKKEEDKEEELKAEKMQQRIGEIDKQINEIDEQLNTIYSGMDFNSEMDAGDGPETPPPESEELQAKIKELQEQQKKLKEEKERIKAQISNKKDIKEEDKKEEGKKEDKKEEGKKEDKKEEDKKEENTPTIGLKKISFSLLDSEGKYNPKYTAEYTNGIQQEAKPTKHKTKREERKAKRELKKSIKNVFKSFGIKISRTELRKMMNHIDVDLLDALSVYDATNDNKTSFGLEYVKAVKDKLNGGKGELPFELSYNTRTSGAENVDRKQASQYNKLAKRMDKIGLGECQTEPSFLEKIFGSKNEMIADKSRMTIDEQIAWYNGSKGEKEFDENLYWSNLREAGYSDEELAQIKAGLEPTAAQKYRESKHVPREQLQPMPEKNRDSEENRNKGRKNEDNEIEND
jgi:myosin heavy subunit